MTTWTVYTDDPVEGVPLINTSAPPSSTMHTKCPAKNEVDRLRSLFRPRHYRSQCSSPLSKKSRTSFLMYLNLDTYCANHAE